MEYKRIDLELAKSKLIELSSINVMKASRFSEHWGCDLRLAAMVLSNIISGEEIVVNGERFGKIDT